MCFCSFMNTNFIEKFTLKLYFRCNTFLFLQSHNRLKCGKNLKVSIIFIIRYIIEYHKYLILISSLIDFSYIDAKNYLIHVIRQFLDHSSSMEFAGEKQNSNQVNWCNNIYIIYVIINNGYFTGAVVGNYIFRGFPKFSEILIIRGHLYIHGKTLPTLRCGILYSKKYKSNTHLKLWNIFLKCLITII